MSDTLAYLMLRNLSEVFGERDSERRMAAGGGPRGTFKKENNHGNRSLGSVS